MLSKFLIVLLFIFSYNKTKGQSYWENVDLYTTANGLPNNAVLTLFQDSHGFLWIGTYHGLCRYDGREFKTFNDGFLSNDSKLLSSIDIIKEDSKGNIWLGTRGGTVASFNPFTYKWNWQYMREGAVTEICFDKNEKVWLGTKIGELGVMQGDSLLTVMKLDGEIRYMKFVDDELLLIISGDRVFLLDTKSNKLKGVQYNDKQNLKRQYVALINSNGKELFYYLVNNEVIIEGLFTKESKRVILPGDFNFNVMKNMPGTLINGNGVVTDGKVLLEIGINGEVGDKINLEQNPSVLLGNTVNAIFEDRSGLIWMGTNVGLYKIDKQKILFKKYTYNNHNRQIKHNYIRSIFVKGPEIWMGSREGEVGVIKFDTITGEQIEKRWYGAKLYGGIIDYDIITNAITADNKGDIWIGGREGLSKFNKSKEIFEVKLPIWDIWAMCFDKEGKLLVGSARNGSYTVDTKTLSHNKITYNGKDVDFPVWGMYRSSKNTIWAGTGKGLFVAENNGEGTYKLTRKEGGKWDVFLGKNIWSIIEDPTGNLWFGTTEAGVFILKPDGRIEHFDMSDGLADNITSCIVPDGFGNVWIGTVNGLSKFNVRSREFTTFREEDGLINNDFNFKAGISTSWGELFFGTKVGVTAFHPEQIEQISPSDAPVEIISLKVKRNDYPLFPDSIHKIELSYDENDISIKFALLEFRKSMSHTYQFMLDGYEKGWQTVAYDNPIAVYTNLPPGQYKFIVRASVDGKSWTEKTKSLNIVIHPAFWQQTYFWVLTLSGVFVIVFILIRRRIALLIDKEREKAKIQKAMGELEMKALRAQMNPHFIFNAIGAIQHYIVKNNIVLANEYLSKFAKLMRLFLESSRSNYTLLGDEIELLKLYILLEKLRFEEKFDYEINIDESLETDKLYIPSMLIQPFVENAINHGLMHRKSKGFLSVRFEGANNNTLLRCIIEDDGIGRQQAAELRRELRNDHISQGGNIVEERVKTFLEMDAIDINIEILDKFAVNGEPSGTLVKVEIPVKDNSTGSDESFNS